ncbi:MAG: hypothetical protein P8Z00_09905, partial [Anaerolineales bacterium]
PEENMETLKRALLISFVLAGVLLIALIWVQGLSVTGTSATVYQPTQASNDFLAPSQTPTPQGAPIGTRIPDQQYRDQTVTPIVGQTQQYNPTQTPDATQTWIAEGYEE